MEMKSTAVIVDAEPANARTIAGHLVAAGYRPLAPAHATIDDISPLQPNIVLMRLTPRVDPQPILKLCRALFETMPRCPIIMYGPDISAQVLQAAMAAGVRRFLAEPVERADLLQALSDVQSQIQVVTAAAGPLPSTVTAGPGAVATKPETMTKKIVVCFSPKGGVGTSTLAVNLAVCLKQVSHRVALVDANISCGNVGVFFNLPSGRSILHAIGEHGEIDAASLQSSMVAHSSGVEVLLSPREPEQGDRVTVEHLRLVLGTLRPECDYVVVDTVASYEERILVALEMADHVVVPVGPDLAAIKNLTDFLRICQLLGLSPEKLILVLTRANSVPKNQIKEIEGFLKQPLRYRIVSDGRRVTSALNHGVPLVMRERDSEVAMDIQALADGIIERDRAPQAGSASLASASRSRPQLLLRRLKVSNG